MAKKIVTVEGTETNNAGKGSTSAIAQNVTRVVLNQQEVGQHIHELIDQTLVDLPVLDGFCEQPSQLGNTLRPKGKPQPSRHHLGQTTCNLGLVERWLLLTRFPQLLVQPVHVDGAVGTSKNGPHFLLQNALNQLPKEELEAECEVGRLAEVPCL